MTIDKQDRSIGCVAAFVVLSGLCLWGFWPEVTATVSRAVSSSEVSHALAVPAGIMLLVFLRRAEVKTNIAEGSAWGVPLIVAGVVLHACTIWPFGYGYVADLSMVLVLAGIVWASCGRRLLRLTLPMLLLLAIAVPIGTRLYANLVIRPETYTIQLTAGLLNLLPGLNAQVSGTDLAFRAAHSFGVVALGESNRGARLMLASAAIGVFVLFSQPRSAGRIIVGLLSMGPTVLLVNLVRFLCWAVVVISLGIDPTSPLPRFVSALCSLWLAYGLFALVCAADMRLFVEVGDQKTTNPGAPD